MLIAMAGLPATGKSTIARPLAQRLPAILLDKDVIRAALFAPEHVEYASAQNDLCVEIMFQVAEYHIRTHPERHVLLDGRTFSKRYQVESLVSFAQRIAVPLRIIECVSDDTLVAARLAKSQHTHLAANRNFDLYQQLKAESDPITEPKLVIDTGKLDVTTGVSRALAYVRHPASVIN
jgi:adenylylsulfate kinase